MLANPFMHAMLEFPRCVDIGHGWQQRVRLIEYGPAIDTRSDVVDRE